MARALTGGELANLRLDGQRSSLYLAVHTPATAYTSRVNGLPASNDKLAEIVYNGGAGTPADAIAGMSVYVSATGYGAYDKGQVRLRSTLAAAAGTMDIGETSEIDWADDDYLTVVDEFSPWPRHIRITDAGVILIDYDIAYSDQHDDRDPIPVLGPPAVKWLTGNAVDVEFDGSDSWVSGSSISSYLWVAPGASTTSGLATATPTITYNAAGTYRVACTVTAANAKTYTGYRYVFIYDADNPPLTVFQLGNCDGDWSRGGWSFNVTTWDDVTRTDIRDRAMVVLFATDWYGSTETSIGPVADRENIVATGWISGESIEWNPEQGSVSFTVQGPQFWFNKMQGFPSGVLDFDGTPTRWTEMEDLTVDKGLWHFLHWRTTASLGMDWTLTDDTRQIRIFDAPPGTLWAQITRESFQTILAHPCCDRYGRLFIEIDSQFLPVAARAAIPTVHTLLTNDWRDRINISRVIVRPVSMLDLSGVAYLNGAATALFSLSPGRVYARYGGVERIDRLALTNQSQSNVLSGLVFGNRDNEYPGIGIQLAANHRGFDVCPHQYGVVSVAATDTERGIVLTSQKIIPRRVSFRHDPSSGTLLTDIDTEAYTTADQGRTGDPPPEPASVPIVTPTLPPLPPEPEPDVGIGAFVLDQDQVAVTFDITVASPVWYDADPNTDLVGVFQSIAVTSDSQAYITTRDDGDEANTGLFHCADISLAVGGTITWTLLKSATQAATDTGYVAGGIDACCLGAVEVNNSDQVCALVHSAGNRPPTAGGAAFSGCYIGSGASVSINLFNVLAGGQKFFQESPILHSVYGGSGSWYIAGRNVVTRAYLCVGPAWVLTDFWTGPGEAKLIATNGDVGGYTVGQSLQVYSGWNPAAPVGGLTVERGTGIFENDDGTHYLYLEDDGNYDLYEDGAGPIGDASAEFGALKFGSIGAYLPGGDEILWIHGTSGLIATFPVLIYSEDGGASWSDKTGNLASEIGATWNGWSSAALANSIVRAFEH